MRLRAFVSVSVMLVSSATAATLEGRAVADHSGSPVASAGVRIIRLNGRAWVADLETDRDGRFRASGLAPGEYEINVSKQSYLGTSLRLRLSGGDEPSAGFVAARLVRFGVVTGRVIHQQNRVVRGAFVVAFAKSASSAALEPIGSPANVDAQGRYRIYDLPPGQYAFAVSYPTEGATAGLRTLFHPDNAGPAFITISGGEEYGDVDFVVSSGSSGRVRGIVEAPGVGTRFLVSLTLANQTAFAVATQETAPDGTFEFEGISAGSYDLLASGPVGGARSGLAAVLWPEPFFGRTRLTVTGDTEGVSVPVRRGFSVPFVLRFETLPQPPSGCPPSARLTLSPLEAWGTKVGAAVEVSFAKESNIGDLAPGIYGAALTIAGDGCYGPASMVVDLGGGPDPSPVVIPVIPAGSIEGRLLTGGTSRPLNLAVVLLPCDAFHYGQTLQVAFPDSESRFTFDRLRPGRYRIAPRLTGEMPGGRLVSRLGDMFEIEVPGGAPTQVDLPLSVIDDGSHDVRGDLR
jgi:hypothetical protein